MRRRHLLTLESHFMFAPGMRRSLSAQGVLRLLWNLLSLFPLQHFKVHFLKVNRDVQIQPVERNWLEAIFITTHRKGLWQRQSYSAAAMQLPVYIDLIKYSQWTMTSWRRARSGNCPPIYTLMSLKYSNIFLIYVHTSSTTYYLISCSGKICHDNANMQRQHFIYREVQDAKKAHIIL